MARPERWGALPLDDPMRVVPLGDLHAPGMCALCGATRTPMHKQVLVWTRAEAMICVSVVNCQRRRRAKRA